MFTSGRSYEGMNYQIEVICKINMLILVWWGGDMRDGHKNHGHTRGDAGVIMMSGMITRLFRESQPVVIK